MNNQVNLLKMYSKEKHIAIMEEQFKNKYIKMEQFKVMYSKVWEEEDRVPYIQLTHLLDSYYCIPERPDMAFIYLWKAINTTYTELFYKQIAEGSDEKNKNEATKIKMSVEQIRERMLESIIYNDNTYTVKSIIELYIRFIPLKVLIFVASYILKGIAIENRLGESASKMYIKQHYGSFKKAFGENHQAIKNTFGKKYCEICEISVDEKNGKCDLFIAEKNRTIAYQITYALACKIKNALQNSVHSVQLYNNEKEQYNFSFKDQKEYLEFIFVFILYAMRNSNIHGDEASRLTSRNANKHSIIASNYIYMLGHMFLNLLLWIDDRMEINDLVISMKNLELLVEDKER